jgi:hypothetical protein
MQKLHNNPIAVWKDNKVVIIPPDEIEIPEYKRTGTSTLNIAAKHLKAVLDVVV